MATTTKVTKEKTTEGPSSTTKTTTYETITSHDSDISGPVYRPLLAPRATIIHRTAYTPPGAVLSRSVERSVTYGALSHIPPNAYSNVSIAGCNNVKQSRVQEKKDMQDLNERLANYIEKVRFLEAQNRKLADELDKLKLKWGKETSAIKAMFQAELDEARKLLDEAEKEKARLEIKCATQDEIIDELRRKLEDYVNRAAQDKEKLQRQDQQLLQYESELNLLRRRLEQSDNDRAKDKKEIIRLTEIVTRTRIDLDNETLNHIDAENRRQTLEEELEFLKQVHEQEMKELAALAYRDTTSENREYWKSELSNALREIQATYDDKLDSMRTELETYYNMKIQEFRTGATRQNMETVHAKEESKRLRQQLTDLRSKLGDLEARNIMLEKELERLRREYEDKEREWEVENTELKDEVAKLRAEMEAILKELQDLMDTKLGLELEIAAYRKLLEGEESRAGLRHVVEAVIDMEQDRWLQPSAKYVVKQTERTSGDSALKVSQVVKGEMSAKTTYQRSAKGPVSIAECSSDGKYICLENTGRKEESVGGWRIKRTVDGNDKVDFVLDKNIVLKPSSKVKVFVAGARGANAAPQDVECSLQSWGVGANIQTKLINPAGEDRATHTQKTTYTS